MFNPRGNMRPRIRGPNMPPPISQGPFQRPGPGPGPGGFPRQFPPGPTHRMPQRFMGSEMRPGYPKPDVQMPQHRMDPRQAGERMNMEWQQKEERCDTHWDDTFPPGSNSRNQPNSGRMAEHTPAVQSRYTSESASTILASFGLSNEDLEELSRYPDDQLTPENMPIILRDIRMRKMVHQLPSLPSPSREKETFCSSSDGCGSMVKGKVIDYGHESKYSYTERPFEVKVFDSGVPAKESMKGFQAPQAASRSAASSTITTKQMNAVEELIRQMGFQRSTPSAPSSNKVPGICLPSAGALPTAPPIPQPSRSVQQAMPPPSPVQSKIPTTDKLPPQYRPEIHRDGDRSDRTSREFRDKSHRTQSEHASDQKRIQKEADNTIKSPFGVVKASWLPVFSPPDAQKTKMPTPSMMNDYYAASPRIFPHVCSLCNVECRHTKDWIQHQNTTAHLDSCRKLCQQFPDWNPESHTASERREGDRKENHTLRRRSTSFSPRRSSSGHARYRTRSRSRTPRYHRTSRTRSQTRSRSWTRSRSRTRSWTRTRTRSRSRSRSRSPRYRFRTPWQPNITRPSFQKSYSRDWRSGRTQLPERMSRTVGKGVEGQQRKRKASKASSRERLGAKKSSSEQRETGVSERKTSKSPAPSSLSKKETSSRHDSSGVKAKPQLKVTGDSSKKGAAGERKAKKSPSGSSAKGKEAFVPLAYSRLMSSKAWSCGKVLRIYDLPDKRFTHEDIKKLVQPFGKVSDVVIVRSRNEAYVEMNYKEAVIAAVKSSETVPMLVLQTPVKLSVVEKPKTPPIKGTEKKVPSVKKPALSTKKDKAPTSAKPRKGATSVTAASATSDKKSTNTGKDTKVKSKPTEPTKPKITKTTVKQKKPAETKKPEEGESAPKSKKATEPPKAEGSGLPAIQPTAVPDISETAKSIEADEPIIKEGEEMCVVSISSVPEAGLTANEINNLAKPFGTVKDFIIVSSHKKAYVEINRKSADSMVKFYTSFPMCVEKHQLCITLAPEFKDLKDEEAIFLTMIKDANPDINPEGLHTQFVHLGNLPDGGYSELEILCVGLRFGRVDHYMVITNKNKAILQLDSAESAASMCRFLKRYPYSLGESQLTFSRSPKIESFPAEVMRKEVRKQELSEESTELKTIPEGSREVLPSTVPSPKATEVKEECSSDLKAELPEVKTEHLKADLPEVKSEHSPEVKTESGTEKEVCEVASKLMKTEMSEEDFGLGAATLPLAPVDLQSSEVKSEEILALPSNMQEEENIQDRSSIGLLGNVLVPVGRNSNDNLATPADKPSGELHSLPGKEVGPDPAATVEADKVEADDTAASAAETVPLVSTGTSGAEETSSGSLSDSKLLTAEADRTEAAENLVEMAGAKVEEVTDKESKGSCSTTEQSMEMEPQAVVEKPELAATAETNAEATAETVAEKQPEDFIPTDEALKEEEPERNVNEEGPEQILPEAQPSEGPGQVRTNESCKTGTVVAEPAPSVEDASAAETPIHEPCASNTKATRQRKEGQKPSLKPATRSRVADKKKPVLTEVSQERPTDNKLDLPDNSKSRLSPSSLAVELGSGKSSPQQNKDPQMETRGSLKQKRETRSSSLKRDNSSTKEPLGRNTRRVRSSTRPAEEEELSLFNLDEFVTMDEVVEEVDSPPPRRNPTRSKRKEVEKKSSHEPSSKRRKGKTSASHAEKSESSFVTLDEIGEDEGEVAQAEPASLEAIPDPQVLVTVDEVNDGEDLMDEVIKDPQSLVTLDEISEQEDSAKEVFALGDNEPDLKAEPLVTVDEIGEIEELPLGKPSHFKEEESLKPPSGCARQGAAATEDLGEVFSSQMPEDPSALVTVDEIQEDSDDQPLVTLDEVAEDDEDFLEDFSCLKEDLTFVTVDEVGSEDEEEENNEISVSTNLDEPVAEVAQKEKTAVSVAEEEIVPSDKSKEASVAEKEIVPSDKLEKTSVAEEGIIPSDKLKEASVAEKEIVPSDKLEKTSVAEEGIIPSDKLKEASVAEKEIVPSDKLKEASVAEEEIVPSNKSEEASADIPQEGSVCTKEELCGGNAVVPDAQREDAEKESCTRKRDRQDAALAHEKKDDDDDKGEDLEGTSKTFEADPGCEQLLAEPEETREASTKAGADERETEETSESIPEGKKTGADLLQSPDLDVSAGTKERAGTELLPRSPKQPPEEPLGTGSEAVPSQSAEKPGKETAEPECEEPEPKQRKVDSAEKAKPPSQPKDLDFLVPKAGFFCQICSCFFVDETSMKTHCHSEQHQQNMEKFMIKKGTQEEKMEVKEEAEELNST